MIWQQFAAGIAAAAVPLLVKVITDWHGVVMDRVGARHANSDIHVPTQEVPAVGDQEHNHDEEEDEEYGTEEEGEPLGEPSQEGKSEAERLADTIRDQTLKQQS